MAESRHLLLHPLLPPSPVKSPAPLDDDDDLKLISSNSGIVLRLFLVAFIGVVSVWANHEASKGYAVTVINESTDAFLATRFKVFYASNDEAARAAITASNIIEKFLFPDSDRGEKNRSTKKTIKSVVIRLVDRDLRDDVAVEADSSGDRARFVLSVSSRVLRGANFDREMALAIRRGVARVWLWDGAGDAPRYVVDGIVEYLVQICDDAAAAEVFEPSAAAAVCWNETSNARSVAEFLRRGERRRPGFIGRLNRAMKDGWSDEKLGGALASTVDELCATASESLRYKSSSV